MPSKMQEIENEENLNGASALIEVSALARVGMLSAGGKLMDKRAQQMELDAKRVARRGKLGRAEHLKQSAVNLRKVNASMSVQREQEQIREPIPQEEEIILQGRATEAGRGKAGVDVTLVNVKGQVVARTISGKNGAYELRPKEAVANRKVEPGHTDSR